MSDTDEEIVSGPRTRGRKVMKGNGSNKNPISDDENDTTDIAASSSSAIIRSEGDIDYGETDSEWESDWASENEGHEISSTSVNITADSSTGKLDYASDSSSSSNEDTEKCPICLLRLNDQEIGSPDVCEHIFCAPCIEEWSKNVTTCPIDRKSFDAINIYESINNKKFIRKESVHKEQSNKEAEAPEEDLTYCELCRSPNSEETMLLCDGCNLGYHMECLNPPLTEIPEGEFFCDNCFQSSDEDLDDQEVNDLLNDLRDIGGMMESRFRRRIQGQPRIPRTRQSERIRGEILRRIATSVASAVATREVEIAPGPSSRRSMGSTTRTGRETVRKRKKRRTRRRIIKKIISEYDVDNKDEKFAMKKKIIYKKLKRRRKGRRTARRSRVNRSLDAADNEADAISRRRVDAGIPTLSIMGNPNTLDYFSDDDEAIGNDGPVATQSMTQRFNQTNALRRRQAVKTGFEVSQSNPLDLLDTIMESQERWHSRNGLKNVKIRGNGALVFNNNGSNVPINKAANEKSPEKVNTGGQSQKNGESSEGDHQQKSSAEGEVSTSSGGTGQIASSSQSGGDGAEPTADYENKAEDHDESSDKKSVKRRSTEEEACPNFSIYSAETLDLAHTNDDSNKRLNEEEEFEEKDVDLVQLGDDEEETDQMLQEIEQKESETPEKENIENQTELEENRSYTPCLDEIHQEKKDSSGENAPVGIDGMDTELISEDEIALNELDSLNQSGAKKKDLFKKVSKKGRDRNYRDKERPSDRSRNRYDDKENNYRFKSRGDRRREKRKEIERYDVRTLIAEKRPRPYKDPFGRDVSPRPKSKSGSKSRSKSREMSISLSPEPRYRRDFRRRTISPRRSLSRGRRFSRSPVYRRSVSISKSRSRNRSRSRRHRSLSRSRSRSPSFDHKMKKTRRRRRRSKSISPRRSVSRRRSHSRLRSRSLSRNRIRRSSPEKIRPKKRKNRGRSRSSSEKRGGKRRNKNGKRRSVSPARSRSRSRSRSPIERYGRAHKNSWTPPLHPSKTNGTAPNLTVILTNEEAVAKQNKKDKEKKKSGKESKRRRDRTDKNQTSKEVFTSGDNILVSVNFNNKDQDKENDKADDSMIEQPSSTSQKKQKGVSKKHRPEPEKAPPRRRRKKKLDAKPVVIIDLDRSPFKVITPSPKAVIVLSDSDHEKEKATTNTGRKPAASPDREMPSSTRKSPPVDIFGPKTPPHPQNSNAPTSTSSASKQQNQSAPKFSMQVKPTKPKVAAVNLLYDPHDLALDKEQDEMADKSNENSQNVNYNTIGPNTPPEPPPDVYDPFEPTKSPSNSPGSDRMADDDDIIDDGLSDGDNHHVSIGSSNSKDGNDYENEQIDSSMPDSSQNNISSGDAPNSDEPPRNSGKITVLSNILINSKPPANNELMFDEFAASSTSYSRITPVKSYSTGQSSQASLISKLPMPPQPSQSFSGGNIADSPYSPGASDFEDLFDQPNENVYKSQKKGSGGGEVFENLFGKSPLNAGGKKKGKSGHKKYGKGAKASKAAADDDESNPHLTTKDRFLKKLHRQERVVEEVKLVIKPYYNKKLINKEEYKDVLRRAVPKICHSKTGEINPMKIQSLIKAYVKKIRHRTKTGGTNKKGNMNNTII